jgi:predicted nucleotidyltransferase
MQIRNHHQQAIDNLTAAYRDDPRFRGLVIGGSVAKGFARPDSDVDFMIIATDHEYEQRLARGDLFINRQDLCDYDGGYVDGKIITLDFLSEVAENGNEPSRAAFEGALIAYSHIADLEARLGRIPIYPETGHAERIKAFYCMAFIQHWLMHEAQRHSNQYAITRAASQLALFAGRLILAHNRQLFPFHKWLPRTLELVTDKPENFMLHFNNLLESPSSETATALFDLTRSFQNWGVSDLDAYTWFMTDVEWSWKRDAVPLEDW